MHDSFVRARNPVAEIRGLGNQSYTGHGTRGASGRFTVPHRLHDNITSGYVVWTNWGAFTQSAQGVKEFIEEAIAKPAHHLIVNNRQMMTRNGTLPWRA